MAENKLLSLRIEPEVYDEIDHFARLWNLSRMDLAKKFIKDSIEEFKKLSLELALEKVEKGILTSEEAAELFNMDVDEFERIAGESGVIEYMEPKEVEQELKRSQKVFGKFKWKR